MFQREPEQPQEHGAGQRHGELGNELAGPPVDERVDQLVDQLGDVGFELGHPARGEVRVEQDPVFLVVRRVDLQRDHGPVIAKPPHGFTELGGEDQRAAQDAINVVRTRNQDHRASLPLVHLKLVALRRELAQPLIVRPRILGELRVDHEGKI